MRSRIINKDNISNLKSYFGLDYGFYKRPAAFMHVKIDEQKQGALHCGGIRKKRI